jgi:carboxyl-terminal processing protease
MYAFKKNFVLTEDFLNKFYAYAEKKSVKRNEEGIKKSDRLIKTQLKALVARDLWNTTAYYYVINDINPFLTKALESLTTAL